jgi:hypothetical protein
MKMLRLAGLGIAIWALSLVWTEVNLILTPATMIGLIVGLVAVAVIYRLSQRRCREDNPTDHTTRHTHPTRPIPVMR